MRRRDLPAERDPSKIIVRFGRIEIMPTFVPGDFITYVLYLAYPGNIRHVEATFRHEKKETWVTLKTEGYGSSRWSSELWEAQLISEPRIEGSRTHVAILSDDVYKWQEPGTYRLEKLQVTTYGDKELTIDSPPNDAFRVEQEPDISSLPSSAVLSPTGFYFPEGHPDRPQGE
jgi:hypothetical protein